MSRRINLRGRVFSLLTVQRFSGTSTNGAAIWLCVCACGNHITVRSDLLGSGKTTSCGCDRGVQLQGNTGRRRPGKV